MLKIAKKEKWKIKKDIINKRIFKVKKKFKIEDNFETNYAKYKDQTQANNPENKENELDENLKKFFSEIDKYDKYILDKNYCSDFKDEDINDSDISYDFNEVIQEVAKKIRKRKS